MNSSPLRYPGGKGRMYGQIKSIIEDNKLSDLTYTEPFAGGFGIGIKLLTNCDVKRVIINDADKYIYAFWYSVFFETDKLVDKIRNTEINITNWKLQKEIYSEYEGDSKSVLGFSAFFLNRTNYSGVLKGGPIGGLEQKGKYKINCRMNKEKLIKRIIEISKFKEAVEIYNYDAIDFIKNIVLPRKKDIFINFDPPYVKKGHELYKNYYTKDNHKELAEFVCNNLKDVKWVMTYDACDLIKDLYSDYNPTEYNLNHYAGKMKIGKEYFIKNLT